MLHFAIVIGFWERTKAWFDAFVHAVCGGGVSGEATAATAAKQDSLTVSKVVLVPVKS